MYDVGRRRWWEGLECIQLAYRVVLKSGGNKKKKNLLSRAGRPARVTVHAQTLRGGTGRRETEEKNIFRQTRRRI